MGFEREFGDYTKVVASTLVNKFRSAESIRITFVLYLDSKEQVLIFRRTCHSDFPVREYNPHRHEVVYPQAVSTCLDRVPAAQYPASQPDARHPGATDNAEIIRIECIV